MASVLILGPAMTRRSRPARPNRALGRAARALALPRASTAPVPTPEPAAVGRRAAGLLALAASACVATPAHAAELRTFYGAAAPPASYGGVGGTTKDKARYSFLVPAEWTEAAITKIEKGSNGTDCRFESGGRAKLRAYVISLNRAGEDAKSFSLGANAERALASLAGSDSDLQDVIANAESISTTTRSEGAQSYIDYRVEGATRLLVTITVDATGRIFAFFVGGPAKSWEAAGPTLVAMHDSFRTYAA